MTEQTISNHSFVRPAEDADLSRRRFLRTATTLCGAVGAVVAAAPFVESWRPSERARSLGGSVEIDVSKVEPGEMIVASWRRQPVFILHRTAAQLNKLRASSHRESLRDPDSSVHQQPDYTKNWHRSVKPEYLIVVGICTHLGCVPQIKSEQETSLGPTWSGGYFCPCHGSRYDLSARVLKGVPAPYNLPVPPHRFLDPTRVVIGENPAGSDFDFDSIIQI